MKPSAGYVFTEEEQAKVRHILGRMPFGAAVKRPPAQVGSLPVLLEWLEELSMVVTGDAQERLEQRTELAQRRDEDEVIGRFLARVLPNVVKVES